KKRDLKVVPAEKLAADAEALLDFARQRGREARQVRTKSARQRVLTTELRDKPDIRLALEAELRDALESDVLPAVETGDSELFQLERQREIQKKALLALKRPALTELAESMDLDKRGKSEDIAERIARALHFNERDVAQLIIENVDEPEPERRYADRVFPV